MKRLITILGIITAAFVVVIVLKNNPATAGLFWSASNEGAWLMPLVLLSSVLDSVHPCSFSILLITIAFLFGMQMGRGQILRIGGVYILGIFVAYFVIGLGILQVLHLFNTPHFMGKIGASLLILFGLLNLANYLFPSFPIRLKLPAGAHTAMGRLMEKASLPAAFLLGILVGLCQFPCMGGPYLMVIGLLRDQVTYFTGFGYLLLYNAVLIIPLVAVLWIAADKLLLEKVQEWKKRETSQLKLWAGLAMVIIGILIFYI